MAPKAPKPQLTPEEKKALRAAKKEARRLLKIEKAKQLQRDYLGRELKYGGITLSRHEKNWRQMLIKLALPKMREDLEYAWHNFERVIDCKNFTISLLLDQIKEAEEQHMMNIRNHVDHIDQLIDLFRERIDELQDDYNNEVANLEKRGEDEELEIKLTAEENENYIKTMLHILEIARKEQKQNVRAEYFSKIDEEEKKGISISQTLKGTLENRFQYIMKDTVRFLSQYAKQTKLRRKEYDELESQDDELQILLVDQLEKLRKACEYAKILKVKLSDSENIMGRKVNNIRDENEYFECAFSTLKRRLVVNREIDVQQLIYLTVNYNQTVEHLEKLRDKAKSILQMSALCRRLETQAEKIQPFPVYVTPDHDHDHDHDSGHHDHDSGHPDHPNENEEEGLAFQEYLPSLELFWQRVAQADASRYAINEEREYLRTQNQLLKLKLYQYCQCISCPIPQRNIITKGVKHITEGTTEQQKYERQSILQFSSSRQHYDIDA